MIACIREEYIGEGDRQRYFEQIATNQIYIRRYVTPSDTSKFTFMAFPDGFPPAPSTRVPG
jgi:hypothetical protein